MTLQTHLLAKAANQARGLAIDAVHACSYGDLDARTVVIFGCGPIGCAAIAVARVQGAAR